jgi:uncharacterized protein YjhX (UPF0386 family)
MSIIGEIKDSILGVYKLATYLKKLRLSREEKELLIAVAPQGEILRMSTNETGHWIRVGNKDFLDANGLAYAAKYIKAFERLRGRGYVRHETGILYNLTDSGFKKARKLARTKQR